MDATLQTITIDENKILGTVSIERETPGQSSIQQMDARKGYHIRPPLKDVSSATPSWDHLQQKLSANTEYVVDRMVAHKQKPSTAQSRVP